MTKTYLKCKHCDGSGIVYTTPGDCDGDDMGFLFGDKKICPDCNGYGKICIDDSNYVELTLKSEGEVWDDVKKICKYWEWLLERKQWKIRTLLKKYNIDDYCVEYGKLDICYGDIKYIYNIGCEDYEMPHLHQNMFKSFKDYQDVVCGYHNNVPKNVNDFATEFTKEVCEYPSENMDKYAKELGYDFEWEEDTCIYYGYESIIYMRCFDTDGESANVEYSVELDYKIKNLVECIKDHYVGNEYFLKILNKMENDLGKKVDRSKCNSECDECELFDGFYSCPFDSIKCVREYYKKIIGETK